MEGPGGNPVGVHKDRREQSVVRKLILTLGYTSFVCKKVKYRGVLQYKGRKG